LGAAAAMAPHVRSPRASSISRTRVDFAASLPRNGRGTRRAAARVKRVGRASENGQQFIRRSARSARMTTPERRYPLGTDRIELERLHLQHQLWSDAAHALWKRAAIQPGSRVLDLGAGPGAATLDLAQLVTAQGRVLAVDESQGFIDFIRSEAQARGLSQVQAEVADVQGFEVAEPGTFGAAYARWVFCFVPQPDAVLRSVARALEPGGTLCVHDYFNYTGMTPAPRRDSYALMVAATARSWRDNGGDPDVVGRLPALLHEHGFTLEHLDVHQRLAR